MPEQLQGPQGAQGAQGAQGTQGLNGAQGQQGVNGPQGLQGANGPQGDIGPAGSQGFQGPQSLLSGQAGPQGVQGAQGSQGGAAAYFTSTDATNIFTGNNNYTALDGPSVQINLTKTSAIVLIFMNVYSTNFSAGLCYMSVSLSGANTVAQSDANSAKFSSPATNGAARSVCGMAIFTGLNLGNTTFSARYKGNSSQTYAVSNRRIVVIPF